MAGRTPNLKPIAQAFRLRLLLSRSADDSPTLAERLTGGLHRGSPPDNADYPYGAIRLMNLRPANIDAPYWTADLELQLFFRPRAESDALQEATDVATEALVGWYDLSVGIYEVDVRDSDTLPPFSEAADPEVITSRTTFPVMLFPTAVP